VGWSGTPGLTGRSTVGPTGLGITELFGLGRGAFSPGLCVGLSPLIPPSPSPPSKHLLPHRTPFYLPIGFPSLFFPSVPTRQQIFGYLAVTKPSLTVPPLLLALPYTLLDRPVPLIPRQHTTKVNDCNTAQTPGARQRSLAAKALSWP